MGRYTLIMESELFGKQIIAVDGNYKTSLKSIDQMTSKFNNKKELFESLDFIIDSQEKYNNFYITYNYNKEEKKLPIAYSNKNKLANVSMKNESTVNEEDKYFIQILSTFLQAIQREKYLHILEEDTTLNAKLKEYLDKWLLDSDRTEFNRGKISQYMSSYKQLRDIIFSFEKYNEEIHKHRK